MDFSALAARRRGHIPPLKHPIGVKVPNLLDAESVPLFIDGFLRLWLCGYFSLANRSGNTGIYRPLVRPDFLPMWRGALRTFRWHSWNSAGGVVLHHRWVVLFSFGIADFGDCGAESPVVSPRFPGGNIWHSIACASIVIESDGGAIACRCASDDLVTQTVVAD